MVEACSSGSRQSSSRLRSRIVTVPSTTIAAIRLRRDAGHLDIMLVGDVADDLLQDVLQGHDAHQRAVFIDHDGEMLVAGAEGFELRQQIGAVGDEPGLGGECDDVEALELPLIGLHRAQQRPWHAARRRCCRARRDRSGCACAGCSAPASTISSTGRSASSMVMLRRCTMMSETGTSSEIQDRMQHLPGFLDLLDRPGMELDGAAQFLHPLVGAELVDDL